MTYLFRLDRLHHSLRLGLAGSWRDDHPILLEIVQDLYMSCPRLIQKHILADEFITDLQVTMTHPIEWPHSSLSEQDILDMLPSAYRQEYSISLPRQYDKTQLSYYCQIKFCSRHSQTITTGNFIKYQSSIAYVSCGIKHYTQSECFFFLLLQPWVRNGNTDKATTLPFYCSSKRWVLSGLQSKVEPAFMIDIDNVYRQVSVDINTRQDLVYCSWNIDLC
ncbi:hypothetical protein BO70DRAFT_367218, partial [Aspergillus heteromorphus CBS 117.55]